MDITSEAIKLLLILLPGFVASILLNILLVRKPKSDFSQVIEALVLTFLVYVVVVGIFRIQPWLPPVTESGRTSGANPWFLLAAASTAVLLPLIVSAVATHDVHMRLLRWLQVTAKTARDNTWLDVFIDQKRYVIANLSGGRRVFGWPMYFSNTPEEGLVYLYDPAWITEEGKYISLNIHGLFLLERGSIESIEFTNLTEENAVEQQEDGTDNEHDKKV